MSGINKIINFFQDLFLTLLFFGKSNIAPGTIGSFISVFIILILIYNFNINYLLLLIIGIILTIISIPIINNYEKKYNIHDSKHIVIDEFVGIVFCFSIILYFTSNIFIFILGFIFFRIFDISKCGIIGYVDKKINGGFGVMFDDILAGFFSGIVCLFIYFLFLNIGLYGL